MRTPCTCAEHKEGATRTIGDHTFELETEDHSRMPDLQQWRARCSCGSRTRWTIQSPNVPYHAWLRHAERRLK